MSTFSAVRPRLSFASGNQRFANSCSRERFAHDKQFGDVAGTPFLLDNINRLIVDQEHRPADRDCILLGNKDAAFMLRDALLSTSK